jgi:DNA-binding response OmpR family regulator
MNGKLILLVEDNKKVQAFNKPLFMKRGFSVETAVTLAEAREAMQRQTPDAIILDIGMPDGSGLDFLGELRRTSNIPVLLLTGYGEDKDIVAGFQTGCDDYLAKPYTFEVLHVRLLRLLQAAEQMPETVSRGSLILRLASREAYVNGVDLLLTPKDFALLQFLVQNENRLMSAKQLYETVWGRPMADDSQALGKAVSRLRQKLKGCGYTVIAEYGTGYCFGRGEP